MKIAAQWLAHQNALGNIRQRVYGPRVYTSKDIGRRLLPKPNRYVPHQGKRECARRVRNAIAQ